MKSKELKLWEGKFGDEYRTRNEIKEDDIIARTNMWGNILSKAEFDRSRYVPGTVSNILEVGCGQGINIIAMNNIFKNVFGENGKVKFFGIEPNADTCVKCINNCSSYNVPAVIRQGNATKMDVKDGEMDLAFTSGVLIHIKPDDQLAAMREIYKKSRHLIICAEYFSVDLTEKYYHGENALWTRDYGSLWLDHFPLRCCGVFFIWKRMTGIDNLTVWVFEKVS